MIGIASARIPFLRLELNDLVWGQTGAAASTRAVLERRHFAGDGPVEVLAVDGTGSLSFAVPRRLRTGIGGEATHPALAAIRPQMLARVVCWETATTQYYREYRIRAPIRDGSLERGIVTVGADPLELDLAKCGPMRELANGVTTWDFEFGARTVAEIVEFCVAQAGLPWLDFDPDFVEPDYTFESFPVSRKTPLATLLEVCAQLRERDIPAEFCLEQSGGRYVPAIRHQIGSGVQLAPLTVRAGQLGIRRTVDGAQQATRVFSLGAADPDGEPGIGGRARWVVANPTSTTFEVSDQNGAAAPIAFANQYARPGYQWWVYRVRTGETWQIQATAPGPPAIITVLNTGSLAAGELIELRVDEPETFARYEPWFTSPVLERRIFEITAIDTGSRRVTIALPWTNGTPLAGDGQYDGWRARLHRMVGGPLNAGTAAADNYYALTSVSGYQAGDWLIPATSASAPYQADLTNQKIATVVTVDTGNNRLYVEARFRVGEDPVLVSTSYAATRIYRPLAEVRVRATDESTMELELASIPDTLSVGDVLELDQPDGAGELPTYVEHPVYVAPPPDGYGVQCAEITQPLVTGIQELGTNPFLDRWAGGANDPPDGWLKTGSATITRTTDPEFVRFGQSIHLADWQTTSLYSERFYHSTAPGRDRLSVRAWVLFTAFDDEDAQRQFTLRVHPCDGAGHAIEGTVLGSSVVYAPNAAPVSEDQRAALGAWVQVAVLGMEVSPLVGRFGFRARLLTVSGGPNNPIAYVGGLDKWGHSSVPDTPLRYGDAPRLVQAGNRHLRDWHLPVAYELAAHNLAEPARRIDRALGGIVPVVNRAYGVDEAQRLLRAEIHHFAPERTQCTLARQTPLLTDYGRLL